MVMAWTRTYGSQVDQIPPRCLVLEYHVLHRSAWVSSDFRMADAKCQPGLKQKCVMSPLIGKLTREIRLTWCTRCS